MRIAAGALLVVVLALSMLGDASFGAYYGDCTKNNVCGAGCCKGSNATDACDAKACPPCTCHPKGAGGLAAAANGHLMAECHGMIH